MTSDVLLEPSSCLGNCSLSFPLLGFLFNKKTTAVLCLQHVYDIVTLQTPFCQTILKIIPAALSTRQKACQKRAEPPQNFCHSYIKKAAGPLPFFLFQLDSVLKSVLCLQSLDLLLVVLDKGWGVELFAILLVFLQDGFQLCPAFFASFFSSRFQIDYKFSVLWDSCFHSFRFPFCAQELLNALFFSFILTS